MSLEDNFKDNIDKWKQYCESIAYSSNPRDYIDCDSYRNLVSIGKDTLPLVKDLYNSGKRPELGFFSLPILVREIVGEDFEIPMKIRGKVDEMEEFTKNWLNKNVEQKYA